jgi:hypothetical protein
MDLANDFLIDDDDDPDETIYFNPIFNLCPVHKTPLINGACPLCACGLHDNSYMKALFFVCLEDST